MASDCEVRTLSSIGSEIKSWCKQNKVNQTELAAALDVSTMTVRRVWKGTKELTSVQIAIMLEVMPHVTADFFIPNVKCQSSKSISGSLYGNFGKGYAGEKCRCLPGVQKTEH